MRVKKELHTDEADRLRGESSVMLTDRCPDRLVVFPSSPCTNIACEYAIKEPGYMNCSFVPSEAGEHTLEAIGDMMGITREGVRVIETRAIKKIREFFENTEQSDHEEKPPGRQQALASRRGDIIAIHKSHKRKDPRYVLPTLDGRELGECSR